MALRIRLPVMRARLLLRKRCSATRGHSMRDAIGRWTGTRSVFQLVTLAGTVFLCVAGCGGGNGSATALSAPPPVTPPAASPPPPPPPAMTTLRGVMTGAHKVIQGASIVLYRVGVRGYGSPATALGSTTTDAAGAWTVSFAKPTDDPLVYVVAGGGNQRTHDAHWRQQHDRIWHLA